MEAAVEFTLFALTLSLSAFLFSGLDLHLLQDVSQDEFLLKFVKTHGDEIMRFMCFGGEVNLSLNLSTHYILHIYGEYETVFYDIQPRVCLEKVRISRVHLKTICGDGYVELGTWEGNAPEVCP